MSGLLEGAIEHQERVLRGDLTRARIIAGLSRKDVARCMGVDSRDVEKIEEGKRDTHLSTLRRYCFAVGVVIDWQLVVPRIDDEPAEDAADEVTP